MDKGESRSHEFDRGGNEKRFLRRTVFFVLKFMFAKNLIVQRLRGAHILPTQSASLRDGPQCNIVQLMCPDTGIAESLSAKGLSQP